MKGGGYYNAHSEEQRSALDVFLPWMEEAIFDLPLPSGSSPPIGLLDLGSSEGNNAIHAMKLLIEAFRRRTDAPIWVFFNDLPSNDFNQLFANLFPTGRLAIPGADIFPAAIGGTAFDRVVPPRSLHVATTFNAIGFLESLPAAKIPNYILSMTPCGPREGTLVDEAEREPFRLQAARDLRRFYGARAEELISGGKLLVEVFGRDEVHSTSDGIYDVLSDALLDAVEDGMLPRKFYEDLIFPVYFRTIEELVAPIGARKNLAEAFRIERAQVREVPVPFNVALENTGDVTVWARSYTGFLRAFTEPVLAAAISDESSRSEIIQEIYRKVELRLATDPGRYEFHYIALGILLTRL
ncbi:MAG: class I SAM-dependent methyltransferase [bacterium]|nr:class I SAM-dependent methyltransferase [bacterium]